MQNIEYAESPLLKPSNMNNSEIPRFLFEDILGTLDTYTKQDVRNAYHYYF